MTDTIFFRLLSDDDKAAVLPSAIEELREDGGARDVFRTDLKSLRQVPGSPFAYWMSKKVRSKFVELPAFENADRTAKRGPSSGDDFRRVRLWWEIRAEEEAADDRWVPFSKGGSYSPYYADVHLLVAWDKIRRTFLDFYGRPGRMVARPEALEYFFRPGLTWPRSTIKGLNVRVLPEGCIFADKGPAAFETTDSPKHLLKLLGLMNSRVFETLVLLQTGSRAWEVGFVQQTPVPSLSGPLGERIAACTLQATNVKRDADRTHETSHVFTSSAFLQTEGISLQERLARWQERVFSWEQQLTESQKEIDDIAFQLYGIEEVDRHAIEESLNSGGGTAASSDSDAAEADEQEEAPAVRDNGALVADLVSYTVGCVFGRWDIRIALDPSLAPELADPFTSLSVCSPGMLVGPDGLPAGRDGIASEEWMRVRPDAITPPPDGSVENTTVSDSEYPLAVDWDGILVDDPDHEDDIVGRVREVFGLLWGGSADDIEAEACEILGVKDLRTYVRNPRKFFDFHVKRYSKSRRKAPIYWLLQSPKRNYGLWIYYQRLDPDLLFKALTNYVEPKIRLEESRLEEYEARRRSAGTGGSEVKKAEKAVDKQEDLLSDLREFRDCLARAANLHFEPDLNDGVVLNIAPLHELVPWSEAASKWRELMAGKYEWSSIGKQLRAKGIVS